jgi:serine/threonine protein kinase
MTNGPTPCKLPRMRGLESDGYVGRRIGERYRVVRWLGEGGQGCVYEAIDETTEVRVAVKVLKPEHAPEAAFGRLEAEASASRRVAHPGVARIVGVGHAGGDAYVAMELVDGPTLRAFRSAGDSLSQPMITAIFVPLVEAVAAVHSAGLVHRDLKPSNVGLLIGEDGVPVPKLLDFGMAKAIEGDAHTTTSGRILGTPHYMSPEQALGEPTNDPRVDVWALGVMLYECLEGQRPYGGATATAVLMNILRLEPRPLSRRTRESPLGAVVVRALERDMGRRFANAGAMHDALVRALDPMTPVRRGAVRRRVLAVACASVLAIGLVGAGWAANESEARGDSLRQTHATATAPATTPPPSALAAPQRDKLTASSSIVAPSAVRPSSLRDRSASASPASGTSARRLSAPSPASAAPLPAPSPSLPPSTPAPSPTAPEAPPATPGLLRRF